MREPAGDLREKVERIVVALERLRLAEYVELLHRPGRLFLVNLLAGVGRGLGLALGFTLLGALVLVVLRRLLVLNLPLVSDLIAEIVRLVQIQLRGGC